MTNDYPPKKIAEYRTRMHRLQEDADECPECASQRLPTDIYNADTICVEHAAAAAVVHHDLQWWVK